MYDDSYDRPRGPTGPTAASDVTAAQAWTGEDMRNSEGRSSTNAEPLAAESRDASVSERRLIGSFDGIVVVVGSVELLLRRRCDPVLEEEPRQACAQLLHLRDLALGVRLRRNVLR